MPPILPLNHNPEQLSAEQRTQAVAALLAVGLHRLLTLPAPTETNLHPGTELSSKSCTNHLAASPTKSVTVHAG